MGDVVEERFKPPKLKMKLKETAAEKEERAWRRERKRLRKESKQIYAANGISPTAGLAVTPPRDEKEESMSPPRKRHRHMDGSPGPTARNPAMTDWDESAWEPPVNSVKRDREAASRMKEDEEYRQKLFDMMEDDEGPNAFVSGRYRDPEAPIQAVPKRWQGSGGSADLPNDEMNEEDYAESIRYGMWKRKNKDEAERLERLERWKKEEASKRAKEKEMKDKEERRRMEVIASETGKVERVRLEKQLQDYKNKWEELKSSVAKVSGDQAEPDPLGATPQPHFRLVDLPWPVFAPVGMLAFSVDTLKPDAIRLFFEAVATNSQTSDPPTQDDHSGKASMRKILREAILAYHPDRFVGRYLSNVRESERETVRDAVVKCSQVINQLAAELKD